MANWRSRRGGTNLSARTGPNRISAGSSLSRHRRFKCDAVILRVADGGEPLRKWRPGEGVMHAMKHWSPCTIFGASLALSFFLSGCGGGGGNSPSGPSVPPIAPTISSQPQNVSVTTPASGTFAVTASGSAPLSFQWTKNGLAISGATSPLYTTPSTTLLDTGATFVVTVSNAAGSVSSQPAVLTVIAPPMAPTISAQPLSISTSQGNTATFSISAVGTPTPSFQWYKNGAAISGATSSMYATPAASLSDSGSTYYVVVSNSAGSVQSASATLTVTAQVYGLGGFMPIFPSGVTDMIGTQFQTNVSQNLGNVIKIIFGANRTYGPSSETTGITYMLESNIYANSMLYADGACTTWPQVGTFVAPQASIRLAIADYPFNGGQEPGITTGLLTGDPVNFPVQTYEVDGIANLWKSDAISQFDVSSSDILVTIQRAGTVTDVSQFTRCGRTLLPGTYRLWTITTQASGHASSTTTVAVLDADGTYLTTNEALHFYSEFLYTAGNFVVQYWNLQYQRESNTTWQPLNKFMTAWNYDGDGSNFGVHVVNVNGQNRIEFSNVPGGSYLKGNTPFSY